LACFHRDAVDQRVASPYSADDAAAAAPYARAAASPSPCSWYKLAMLCRIYAGAHAQAADGLDAESHHIWRESSMMTVSIRRRVLSASNTWSAVVPLLHKTINCKMSVSLLIRDC